MIAPYIDYTLLRPQATVADIQAHCQHTLQQGYHAVCVPPSYVGLAKEWLGDAARVATVVDYPNGYSPMVVKVNGVFRAIEDGADELDVVLNIGYVKSGLWAEVDAEISTLRLATRGRVIKLIIEAGLLTEAELVQLCSLDAIHSLDYVKNSTGVHGGDASPQLIAQLRRLLPAAVRIKASGGIRTPELACQLIQAGADRIGTSTALQYDYICS